MEPTIADREVVWVFQWAFLFRKPRQGEIVVFRFQNQELVKRVVARSENSYQLQGDNHSDSLDSRKFGSVQGSSLIGKVVGKD